MNKTVLLNGHTYVIFKKKVFILLDRILIFEI